MLSTPDSPSDEELAARHLRGDTDAFGALVGRYADRLYRFAHRFTRDDEDTEDIVQETFIRAYEHLPSLKLDSPLKPWLYHVCTNLCRNLAAKRRSLLFSQLESEDGDMQDMAENVPDREDPPDALLRRKDVVDLVRAAVGRLPEKYRVVVELYYYDDLSYQEIADALGLPLNTIRTHLNRAKAQLHLPLKDSAS